MTNADWTPPFEAMGIEDMACPACGNEGNVMVRDQCMYPTDSRVDAYCGDCRALLSVDVAIEYVFGDAKVRK